MTMAMFGASTKIKTSLDGLDFPGNISEGKQCGSLLDPLGFG